MLDPIGCADHFKPHWPRICCVPVSGAALRTGCPLSADLALTNRQSGNGCRSGSRECDRHALQQVLKESPCCLAVCFVDQLRNSELAGAVPFVTLSSMNSHKELQLAFLGSDLRDIDMEIANRVALEFLPLRSVALDIRQVGYAMPM